MDPRRPHRTARSLAGTTSRRGFVGAVVALAGGERAAAAGRLPADAERRFGQRCGPRRTNCGTQARPDCRNLNRDHDHCGSCDNACASGERCARGRCLAGDACGPAPVHGYRIVATYDHDPEAFTQGLDYVDGVFYEGTGLVGRSSLRIVEIETGRVLRSVPLSAPHFGEGIVVFGNRVYQITWQTNTSFVYDRETLEPIESFTYTGEGWGLATDGERLVMSDGSARLTFRDPETFEPIGQVLVQENGAPVTRLNELEVVGDEVWANVWQTDRIARIDPGTGCVKAWLDLAGLRPSLLADPGEIDVLNGIAWDETTGRLFVTGKLWPKLFEIEVVEPETC